MKNSRHDLHALAAVTGLAFLAVLCSLAWPGLRALAANGIFTIAGSFSNSAHSIAAEGQVNNCDTAQIWRSQQGSNYAAYGAAGCTDVPGSSSNHEAGGVLGAVTNASPDTNAVGGAFYALATAPGIDGASDAHRVRLWGFNSLQADQGYAHVLMNNEQDFNVTGSDTKIVGQFSSGASTQQLAPGSVWMNAGPVGAGVPWPIAYGCAEGGSVLCIQVSPASSANNSPSSKIRLLARNGAGVINTVDVWAGAGGGLFVNFSENLAALRVQHNGVDSLVVNSDGGVNPQAVTLASLGAPGNFTIKGCSDCVNGSNPCTIGGSGAIAKRLAGAWDCR